MQKVKRSVHCRSELDGSVTREWDETRMVYTRSDGSEYINHMGAPKDLEDGVAIYRARSVKAHSINDVMAAIGGGPGTVIGMFDFVKED